MPASSRWIAKRRTRIRQSTCGRVSACTDVSRARGDEQPVTDRQDRRGEPGIAEDGRVERTRAAVFVSSGERTGTRHASAPQDVVGGDERAGREARHERVEIACIRA